MMSGPKKKTKKAAVAGRADDPERLVAKQVQRAEIAESSVSQVSIAGSL